MPVLRQYTAIAICGRAILIGGPPGSGKTTLALALIDRGAKLVGDDGIALEFREGALIASPAPPTAGLIEIRNVGIIRVETVTAQAALILDLVPDAPRYVEQAEQRDIEGVTVPCLAFSLGGQADALRAEYALRQHGLSLTGTDHE